MRSERILLTPPSLDYASSMYDCINKNRTELSVYLPWVTRDLTLADIECNTLAAIDNCHKFQGEFWFNIIDAKSAQFIGAVGFIIRDRSVPYFEVGYWLDPGMTGQGYITESIELIERYAFHDHKANRLEIKMAGSNIKSRAVAERCGYRFEACLANGRRLPSGKLDSTVIYSKMGIPTP